jgi:hypothetical protein
VSDEMKEKLIGTSDEDEDCDEDECEDENSNEIPE